VIVRHGPKVIISVAVRAKIRILKCADQAKFSAGASGIITFDWEKLAELRPMWDDHLHLSGPGMPAG